MRTSRLEAFSDGVLAIIITIMVLELHQPTGPDRATLGGLVGETGSSLLTYLLSFVYVGIYWTNHHHMFQVTRHVTGGVLWANLGLLFCLLLLPFTTEWMDGTHFAQTPVVIYGVNLLIAANAYYILQTVIIRTQGEQSALRQAIGGDIKGKLSPFGYIIGAVAAIIGGAGSGWGRPGIWIAVTCYVAMAAWWVIPDRRIETAIVVARPDSDSDPDAEE